MAVKQYIYASFDQDGKKGDSSGREVKIAPAYNFGQTRILRICDTKLCKKFIQHAVDGANNDDIGYSQARRYTLVDYCKAGHTLKALKKKRDCDCSSFITALMYSIGIMSFNYWSYTGTCEQDFISAMKKYKVPYKVMAYDPAKVKAGDILLNKKTHVAIAYK